MNKVVNMKSCEELNQCSINKFDVVIFTAIVFLGIFDIGLALKDHDLLCAYIVLSMLIDCCRISKLYSKSPFHGYRHM